MDKIYWLEKEGISNMSLPLEHDRLRKKLRTARKRIDKINILNTLSAFSYRNEPQESLDLSTRAFDLSSQIHNKNAMGDSLTQISACNHVLSNYSEGNNYLDKALTLYEEGDNVSGIATVLHKKAGIALELGEFNEASVLSIKATEIRKRIQDKNKWEQSIIIQAGAYCKCSEYSKSLELLYDVLLSTNNIINKAVAFVDIGYIYYLIGEYSQSREFCQKAVNKFKSAEDSAGVANTLIILGKISRRTNPDEALGYFSQAHQLHCRLGDKKGIATTLLQMASIYMAVGSIDRALPMGMGALQSFQRIVHRESIIEAKILIGEMQYLKRNYPEALEFLLDALRESNQLQSYQTTCICLKKLAAIYRDWGHIGEGFAYLNEYFEVSDRQNKLQLGKSIAKIERQAELKREDVMSLQLNIAQLGRQFPTLSKTELNICAYVKERRPSKEIATSLNLSLRTVESHRLHIRKKLSLQKNIDLESFLSFI